MIYIVLTALAAGFLHALAPDHWLPFTALGRANGWSRKKLAFVMIAASTAHLASALGLGLAAIHFGFSLEAVLVWESARAQIMPYLLAGFGLAYIFWALKTKVRRRAEETAEKLSGFLRILFVLIIFGPCEPLIPILFAAALNGGQTVFVSMLAFSAATLTGMILAAQLAYAAPKMSVESRLVRFSHVTAGGLIVVTGVIVGILGI